MAVFYLYNFEQHCPEDNQSLIQCFVSFYLIIGLSDQSMFFSPAQSDPSSLMIAYIFYPKMSFKWSFNALFLLQSLENWQTLLINVCVHTVYHKIIIPSFVFLAESKHWVNPLDVALNQEDGRILCFVSLAESRRWADPARVVRCGAPVRHELCLCQPCSLRVPKRKLQTG